MSRKAKPKIRVYNIDDVNKKILAKAVLVHLEHEFVGPQNKYRDEDYEIYKLKRRQFYDAAKKYKELNKMTLLNSKNKLDIFSINILRYYDSCECEALPRNLRCCEELNTTGLLLRKRTERPIHEMNIEQVDVCSIEPWFKRYLKLCKFIHAARTIIVKNRLLKNLEVLRELDEETVAMYEAGHKKFDNVSYAHIFEKFIN